jgi:hypothetical protein
VQQFFSGHYQQMRLNVQALVDSNSRFLYAGILKGSSDYKAYMKSTLMSWIEQVRLQELRQHMIITMPFLVTFQVTLPVFQLADLSYIKNWFKKYRQSLCLAQN